MKVKPGVICAIVGSSQSGKTAYVKTKLAQFNRTLTWDIEGQYDGVVIKTKNELIEHIEKVGAGASTISFRPGGFGDFEFFCQCAYVWGLIGEDAGVPTIICAEETADVTSPAKAPDAWGQLLRKGKKRGLSIYAITQRLAESDKTAIGNADFLHCCRLVIPSDRGYMANILDMPVDDIAALKCDQDKKRFDYIQCDLGRQERVTGVLTFPRDKAKYSKLLH